jgi:hypothetical protein
VLGGIGGVVFVAVAQEHHRAHLRDALDQRVYELVLGVGGRGLRQHGRGAEQQGEERGAQNLKEAIGSIPGNFRAMLGRQALSCQTGGRLGSNRSFGTRSLFS